MSNKNKNNMVIPQWFTFTRRRASPPASPLLPEVLGRPLDSIPPHHQNIVSRADWKAMLPYRPKPKLQHPIKWMKLTYTTNTPRHTTAVDCIEAMRDLQWDQVQQAGIDDIQYNFVIGGDARVYEGRGWFVTPENEIIALEPWQDKFIDIAFMGDDKGYKVPPSYAQYKAAWQLIQYGIENKYISEQYKVI